ncbi:MAG: hypothetical protein SOU51_03515 [Collinsella sp.]|nr:hypothetical protein [Collinsella sp.]
MAVHHQVERDIEAFARYWGLRKESFLEWTFEIYEGIVKPVAREGAWMEPLILELNNMAFTEWILFECEMREGRTPLQLYIDNPPEGVGEEALERLRDVERTQFFSRFAILDKDLERGVAALRDVRTDLRYDVIDPHLCEKPEWGCGTIAQRIAKVGDEWAVVGQMCLYDRAPAATTAVDGPGEFHPEDADLRPELREAGFFLRLMHDVLGVDGRYRRSLKAVSS